MPMSQGPRRSREPKATCAGPLCEDPSPCRGLRPHHARRERAGTWETSSGPQSQERQEVEKAKLSGNRRGVGWVHSTEETLEQSREEQWRKGRREGTQSEEEVGVEARPGHSAGYGNAITTNMTG